MDVTKLYKWKLKNYTNESNKRMWTIKMDMKNYTKGFEKTIKMELTKLYKWISQDYITGCDRTIQMNETKLYK